MSVLEQLQQYATEGGQEASPRFSEDRSSSDELAQMEEMMQAQPIPGQSLTQDPESKLPYEQPPEFSEIQDWLDESFLVLSDPEKLPELLDIMREGAPLEFIAEKYLMKAMQEGQISPDLLMLSIEPIIYTLISLATYANIDAVLYPEDDMTEDEESMKSETNYYRNASRDMMKDEEDEDESTGITVGDLNAPANAPKSLLERSKKAVQAIKGT